MQPTPSTPPVAPSFSHANRWGGQLAGMGAVQPKSSPITAAPAGPVKGDAVQAKAQQAAQSNVQAGLGGTQMKMGRVKAQANPLSVSGPSKIAGSLPGVRGAKSAADAAYAEYTQAKQGFNVMDAATDAANAAEKIGSDGMTDGVRKMVRLGIVAAIAPNSKLAAFITRNKEAFVVAPPGAQSPMPAAPLGAQPPPAAPAPAQPPVDPALSAAAGQTSTAISAPPPPGAPPAAGLPVDPTGGMGGGIAQPPGAQPPMDPSMMPMGGQVPPGLPPGPVDPSTGAAMNQLMQAGSIPEQGGVDMKFDNIVTAADAQDPIAGYWKYAGQNAAVLAGAMIALKQATNNDVEQFHYDLAIALNQPEAALAALRRKSASQDNSAPRLSATGESKGLKYNHKPDHYAQGPDAWNSVSQYFKGHDKRTSQPDPFMGKHAVAIPPWAGRGARATGKFLADWAAPAAVGGTVAYKAHQSGIDPISSGLLGVAGASASSPRDYAKGIRQGLGAAKATGDAPMSGILSALGPMIKRKAGFTALAAIPAVATTGIKTMQNMGDTSTAMKDIAEQAAGGKYTGTDPLTSTQYNLKTDQAKQLAPGLFANAEISPEVFQRLKVTKNPSMGESLNQTATNAMQTTAQSDKMMGEVNSTLQALRQPNQRVNRLLENVNTGIEGVKKHGPKALGILAGGAALTYLVSKALSRKGKRPPAGVGPKKTPTRITLKKPGDYNIRYDTDENEQPMTLGKAAAACAA